MPRPDSSPRATYRNRLPSGRNDGHRCEVAVSVASVIGSTAPVVVETLDRPLSESAPKTMVPSGAQAPPRALFDAWQMSRTVPVAVSTDFRRPFAKKPTVVLSGAQKGSDA